MVHDPTASLDPVVLSEDELAEMPEGTLGMFVVRHGPKRGGRIALDVERGRRPDAASYTEALGQASPRFATLVSFVFTREQSVSWKMLVQKQTTSIFDSNASFFKMLAVPRSFLESLFQEFLVPFIVKADAVLATKDCEYWDVKRLSGAHCRLFAAHIHKLKSVIKSLQQEQTKSVQQLLFIQKNAQQILSGFFLASAFHSFGAVLPLKLKRLFEDAFLAMRHPIAASVKVSAH